MGDAVQQHVHLADGPGGADVLLAEERQVIGARRRIRAGSRGIWISMPPEPHRRVVDAHALLRVDRFRP